MLNEKRAGKLDESKWMRRLERTEKALISIQVTAVGYIETGLELLNGSELIYQNKRDIKTI